MAQHRNLRLGFSACRRAGGVVAMGAVLPTIATIFTLLQGTLSYTPISQCSVVSVGTYLLTLLYIAYPCI